MLCKNLANLSLSLAVRPIRAPIRNPKCEYPSGFKFSNLCSKPSKKFYSGSDIASAAFLLLLSHSIYFIYATELKFGAL